VSPGPAAAVALTFVWLGMVVAISFIEAPLKFRAPGSRCRSDSASAAFRALNTTEVVIALGILSALRWVIRRSVSSWRS
jgi:hypothetical protein